MISEVLKERPDWVLEQTPPFQLYYHHFYIYHHENNMKIIIIAINSYWVQNFLSKIVLRKGEIEEKEKGVSALRRKGETVKS